jgi:hypothetical protein
MTLDSNFITIQSRDYWFKIVDFLQQNWALVDAVDKECVVWFLSDTSGVFDDLRFPSASDAEAALRANGFNRLEEDPTSAAMLRRPEPPFVSRPPSQWPDLFHRPVLEIAMHL